MADSAYDLGNELFDDFKSDDFFAPAFKDFSWVETTTTGSVFGGGTPIETTYTGSWVEKGGSSKAKKVSAIDGILNTDKYVVGKIEEAKAPPLNQKVTYNGNTFTVVYVQTDPVEATFELFLRA